MVCISKSRRDDGRKYDLYMKRVSSTCNIPAHIATRPCGLADRPLKPYEHPSSFAGNGEPFWLDPREKMLSQHPEASRRLLPQLRQ